MIRLGLAAAAGGAAFALRRLAPKVREMQDTPGVDAARRSVMSGVHENAPAKIVPPIRSWGA